MGLLREGKEEIKVQIWDKTEPTFFLSQGIHQSSVLCLLTSSTHIRITFLHHPRHIITITIAAGQAATQRLIILKLSQKKRLTLKHKIK